MITLAITTCKRLELFKRTIDSFYRNCVDADLISRVVIGDDGSDHRDLEEMLKIIPSAEIIKNKVRGHKNNMANIVDSINTKFFFLLEDDWVCAEKISIAEAIGLLTRNDRHCEYCYITKTERHAGLIEKEHFVESHFVVYGFNDCIRSATFNPSVWRTSSIKGIKLRDIEGCFEEGVAMVLYESGYLPILSKTSKFNHIGKECSAYKLNGTDR